ncbi:unnamed protein product, partial [Didymodactylos carnosus]
MTDNIHIRLLYWDCRGAVQPVRYMLADIVEKYSNVNYTEDFEYVAEAFQVWPKHKQDANISGPFGTLPVLHWNDEYIIAQTLPIAQLLARKFGLYGKPKDSTVDMIFHMALLDSVVSCAYTDILLNMFTCIWANADFNDKNSSCYRIGKKMAADTKVLDKLLKQSSTPFFYDQQEPTIADYFVFEAFTLLRDITPRLLHPIDDDCKTLQKHEQAMRAQPGIDKYFKLNLLHETVT